MSAGWKKKVTSGKRFGSSARSACTYSAVDLDRSCLNEIRISPSAELIAGESTKAMFTGCGWPMLSIDSAMSAGGMISRMAFCILVNTTSVSSRRVPGAAFTCMRICPASTCGKKSRPMNGTTARLANPTRPNTANSTTRLFSDQSSERM